MLEYLKRTRKVQAFHRLHSSQNGDYIMEMKLQPKRNGFATFSLVLAIAALASMLFYFYWLAPRVFSEDWFEQAIVHFGVNTGVTAAGFMLLRVVDPDLETLGSKAYAIQEPFTSPLFGGGIVTALIPMAIATYGNVKVGLVSLAIFVACILIAMLLGCWHKPDRAYKNQK